jgi:hypothetical protein
MTTARVTTSVRSTIWRLEVMIPRAVEVTLILRIMPGVPVLWVVILSMRRGVTRRNVRGIQGHK